MHSKRNFEWSIGCHTNPGMRRLEDCDFVFLCHTKFCKLCFFADSSCENSDLIYQVVRFNCDISHARLQIGLYQKDYCCYAHFICESRSPIALSKLSWFHWIENSVKNLASTLLIEFSFWNVWSLYDSFHWILHVYVSRNEEKCEGKNTFRRNRNYSAFLLSFKSEEQSSPARPRT